MVPPHGSVIRKRRKRSGEAAGFCESSTITFFKTPPLSLTVAAAQMLLVTAPDRLRARSVQVARSFEASMR